MKEATGELNMTVITVVAIAAVGLLFTMFVWPNIQANLLLSTACSSVNSNGNYSSADAGVGANGEGTVECTHFECTAHYNNRDYTRNCLEE
ncbi:MAG: hypothetical protein IJA94_03765 [Bacilli bacterium]|nr:hypothetical protein [Bacilli bacterium]